MKTAGGVRGKRGGKHPLRPGRGHRAGGGQGERLELLWGPKCGDGAVLRGTRRPLPQRRPSVRHDGSQPLGSGERGSKTNPREKSTAVPSRSRFRLWGSQPGGRRRMAKPEAPALGAQSGAAVLGTGGRLRVVGVKAVSKGGRSGSRSVRVCVLTPLCATGAAVGLPVGGEALGCGAAP